MSSSPCRASTVPPTQGRAETVSAPGSAVRSSFFGMRRSIGIRSLRPRLPCPSTIGGAADAFTRSGEPTIGPWRSRPGSRAPDRPARPPVRTVLWQASKWAA
ncbi:hypothetical protein GCM10010505_55630 [Kitasatospora aburaviensis]